MFWHPAGHFSGQCATYEDRRASCFRTPQDASKDDAPCKRIVDPLVLVPQAMSYTADQLLLFVTAAAWLTAAEYPFNISQASRLISDNATFNSVFSLFSYMNGLRNTLLIGFRASYQKARRSIMVLSLSLPRMACGMSSAKLLRFALLIRQRGVE